MKDILNDLAQVLKRDLLFVKIATTGLDIVSDEIVYLYLCRTNGVNVDEVNYLLDSDIVLKEEVIKVHGITTDLIEGKPKFQEIASDIYTRFFKDSNAVICGYGINSFTVPFIVESLSQSNIKGSSKILAFDTLDVHSLYAKLYPNNLASVYERLLGQKMSNVELKDDVVATVKVLDVLMDKIPSNSDISIIEKQDEVYLDADKFFKRNISTNIIYFAKGKYLNKEITSLSNHDFEGYTSWLLKQDGVSKNTKDICQYLIKNKNK